MMPSPGSTSSASGHGTSSTANCDTTDMKPQGSRTALVAYGSQSGNAQDLAEEIGELLQRLHFVTRVIEMNRCDPQEIGEYSYVQFVCSTTGQGTFPDNAKEFWRRLLRRRLSTALLNEPLFGIVGLGDRSYPQYNWAARKLEKRLLQLGSRLAASTCEVDESSSIGFDDQVIPWLEALRQSLLGVFPLPAQQQPLDPHVFLPPRWWLGYELVQNGGSPKSKRPLADGPPRYQATVGSNHRITPESHWQDVRLLELAAHDLPTIRPGDTIGINPENSDEDVEAFLRLLGASQIADERLAISTEGGARVDIPLSLLDMEQVLTLRMLAMKYFDLNAVPRRSLLRRLSHFAHDRGERERLQELSGSEYAEEYYDYATRSRRTLLEVLQDFSSLKIPWKYAAGLFPAMHVRWFSIAGSRKVPGTGLDDQGPIGGTMVKLDLLIAIVDYQTVIRKRRKGVCTHYITRLTPGTHLNIFLQTGQLTQGHGDAGKPAIIVCTGTGIAPMRALLHERRVLGQSKSDKVLLFFGARNESADFFFQDEWAEIAKEVSLQIFTAFSQDQKQKIYVQDRLLEQKEAIWDVIGRQDGEAYVCGSSGRMPAAVRQALQDIVEEKGGLSAGSAATYIAKMVESKRYKQETW